MTKDIVTFTTLPTGLAFRKAPFPASWQGALASVRSADKRSFAPLMSWVIDPTWRRKVLPVDIPT